ncbi:hypothetical protein P344_05910 [Spiroplasma mirum ATCC 29335]|uniref:Hypoxanthine-guanine phosphoribosyltransferase n=1 Tax=Spiroplasma mirum ATCC 29335 TaxID=838561 RepID=W0GRU6_9MOLU|nr:MULTISPECIES: phosphoribosyltransferase family protein [Spiroplasma]AHF61364.1 hypoxanthine-guanine phosphoribosyltransferase [Spiroplasma mirum ATCC 29335]AHI58489.1 hypothetical protein P344_05910 [Spiroplasma mirum ATCC 29335]AKM53415.1 hypoxanthine-guanine phosphoribosyltransferase [Spiroplasma atrichopogonis]
MNTDKLELYISEAEIQEKIKEYAQKLNAIYQGKTLHCVGIMNGALFFMSDLLRHLDTFIVMDTISVLSYLDGKSTDKIVFNKHITKTITGQDVLLIEDIIDTGKTLDVVVEELKKLKPASLRIVCLADKPDCHPKPRFEYDYLFALKNEFVVGYGFDYNDKYRQLKGIYIYKVE